MNRYDSVMRNLKATLSGFEAGEQPIIVSEEEVQEAERQLGATLPKDYREFVRDFSAFGLPPVVFDLESNADGALTGTLEMFYGIIQEDGLRSLDVVENYLGLCDSSERWSPEMIPIGIDAGCSTIGLVIRGERRGAVYFYNHEGAYLVADTFDEFIHSLQNEDDEREVEEAEEKAERFWATYRSRG